uniref:Uncharacterized protein n=1 Tax=Anguilla anguilla TaxID=7936 RepID=A0A0E9RYP9_ANGAN
MLWLIVHTFTRLSAAVCAGEAVSRTRLTHWNPVF